VASLNTNTGAKRAREAREELGYTREGPLPDLLEVIEQVAAAHVVVLALPEGVAGAYVAKPGCPLLFVNGQQAPTRQRFTLAHEFGHHHMGHSSVVDEQASIGAASNDPNEVRANAFAAEFLMPRDAVRQWASRNIDGPVTLEHVILFAYEYGVSTQAARYAFETANVITDWKRAELLDQEIKEGLHSELALAHGLEPLEDSVADAARRLPRIPPALSVSALGDLLAGAADISGLAATIGRDPEAVEAMLAELGLDRLLPEARASHTRGRSGGAAGILGRRR
jgi:Zn-dependent peptidase ImmA (M78 family)